VGWFSSALPGSVSSVERIGRTAIERILDGLSQLGHLGRHRDSSADHFPHSHGLQAHIVVLDSTISCSTTNDEKALARSWRFLFADACPTIA
jgi:hypothetical protein